VNVELARQHWLDGARRVERARDDPRRYARLNEHAELIVAALRRRVGQSFTLADLARAYDGAEDWARDLLEDARDDDSPPPDAALCVDAAFHIYARGATDYSP
jgi:hypothetical protein